MAAGILAQTRAALRRRLGPALGRLRVARAVVGIVFSGVELSDGSGGMASTPRPEDLSPRASGQRRQAPPPGSLAGVRVERLLDAMADGPFARSLGLAALSALSARLLAQGPWRVVWDADALDLFDPKPGQRVVLVGAFHSYIARLRALRGVRLRVLELRREALRPGARRFFAPAASARTELGGCDAALITGAALANGTMDSLLGRIRPGAWTAVVGPSGSLLPDALFLRGVSLVGGCVLTDPGRALDLLSQGASARHLYAGCARKVNLLRS